jgi:hypothetical protein
MTEALRTLFALRHREGYVAFLPLLHFGEAQKTVFHRICDRLESVLGLPVLITPGPRYLHAFGQLYLGGPAKGLFLIVTAAPQRIWPFRVRTIPSGSCNSRSR